MNPDTISVPDALCYCLVTFLAGFFAAAAVGSWLERKRRGPIPLASVDLEQSWAGWDECAHCHGKYPEMTSDYPGYCCEACLDADLYIKFQSGRAQ